MAIVDGLPSLSQLSSWSQTSLVSLRLRAVDYLERRVCSPSLAEMISACDIGLSSECFGIGPFNIPIGAMSPSSKDFNFDAPTTKENAFRLLRACQVNKPILLEGSPGVGKTSLVTALASASGQKLYRINLSEQTDLVDLFGSDLPLNGSATGQFAWSDADFLKALKEGHWVLLDEMNLASQSVLEGLNAVFDHRGTVYIPELDRSFSRHPGFRIFTAQNPLNQGSGRKGLPKSFLNRFTKVYVEQLSSVDLFHICNHLYPTIPEATLQRMIEFNSCLHEEVVVKKTFGTDGQPWEFNLRDILRWASLLCRHRTVEHPWMHLNTVYASRFRQSEDRQALCSLFENVFSAKGISTILQPRSIVTPHQISSGSNTVRRGKCVVRETGARFLRTWQGEFEAALTCVAENWLIIITGPEKSGKTSFTRSLASLANQALYEISMGSSSDTSDLIGSFEQLDANYQVDILHRLIIRCIATAETLMPFGDSPSFRWLCKTKGDVYNAMRSRSLRGLADIAYAVVDILKGLDLQEECKILTEFMAVILQHEGQGLSFGWVDGPLMEAMRHGDWLLLDNANLCSPSVLDRLNSLCELNGSLILTEKGKDQSPLVPHPNFRLIMTVNPRHGEISRAMRNRGVEISLQPFGVLNAEDDMLYSKRIPSIPSPKSGILVHSRSSFDLYRRALLPPVLPSQDQKSIVQATNIVHEDSFASRLIQLLDVVQRCGEIPADLLQLFFAEVTLPQYLSYFRRTINLTDVWYDKRGYSNQTFSQALDMLSSSKKEKTNKEKDVSGANISKYLVCKTLYTLIYLLTRGQMHSRILCTPFVNWVSEEAIEQHIQERDILESLVIASFTKGNINTLVGTTTNGAQRDYVPHEDKLNENVHELLTRFPKVLLNSTNDLLNVSEFVSDFFTTTFQHRHVTEIVGWIFINYTRVVTLYSIHSPCCTFWRSGNFNACRCLQLDFRVSAKGPRRNIALVCAIGEFCSGTVCPLFRPWTM